MRFCCSPVCYILRSNVRSFGTSFVLRKVKPWQAERSTTIWESVGVMLGFAGVTVVGVAALNTIDKRMYRYWVMKGRRKLEKNFSSCGTFVETWGFCIIGFQRHWDVNSGKALWLGIVGTCVAVFFLKRLPRMNYFIYNYFVSHYHSKGHLPMFLSIFNHGNVIHLGLNLLMLYHTVPHMAVEFKGKGMIGTAQFFLIAGLFSAMVSYHSRVMLNIMSGSIGMSGAIYAMWGYLAYFQPNHQVQPLFLPFSVDFNKFYGFIVAVDIFCILTRRNLGLDHFAHVGGAIFALLCVKFNWVHYMTIYTAKTEKLLDELIKF